MIVFDYAAWGVIAGLALMLVGGLVLWAYGARRDQTVAAALTVSGPEAEATKLFHTKLTKWFLIYGRVVICAGMALLIASGLSYK